MHAPESTIPIYHGRRWPVGLANAARRLKVSRGHLQQVLSGARKSARLTKAYGALVDELKANAA
jgi:hypothetical protein